MNTTKDNNLNETRLNACDSLIALIDNLCEGKPPEEVSIRLYLAKQSAIIAARCFNHNQIESGRREFQRANEYLQKYYTFIEVA